MDEELLAIVNAEVQSWLKRLLLSLPAADLAGVGAAELPIAELVARISAADFGVAVADALDEAVRTGVIPERWDRSDRPQEIVTTGLRNNDPRLTFQAALRSAYGAGRYERAVKSGKPYLIYRSRRDSRVRAEHQALNGLVMSAADFAAKGLLPPLDPRCRCLTYAIDDPGVDTLRRAGVEIKTEAPAGIKSAEGWGGDPETQLQNLSAILQGRYDDLLAGRGGGGG